MADIIQLLPDAIANQIAAGEVVQRPASVVKELMENSIDAGCSSITLIVKEAGKTLIQVVDDGCGMSATDARLCFERHATSKIRQSEDLFRIKTMGFRGEAMASIAAIAHVELKTRKAEDELGTCIIIEGSEIKSQEPCQCDVGTSIAVKNLFFNTPARRNFLKSNPVENRHLIDEFNRVVLAHPEISFSMFSNGVETFRLNPGNLRKRVVGVMGEKYNKRLIPIEVDTDMLKVEGFVAKPEYARKTRTSRYIFVNRRFIKSGYLNHAVLKAYESLMPADHYPFFAIYLEIDPNKIDINVHPTKQEIKFDDERVVYTFLQAAIKRALGVNIMPALDFDREASLDFGQVRSSNAPLDSQSSKRQSSYVAPTGDPMFDRMNQRQDSQNWEELYKILDNKEQSEPVQQALTLESDLNNSEQSLTSSIDRLPSQIHQRFILTQIKSGFILVDQQAAHERVLYEQYLDRLENGERATQKLLFPQTIELAKSDHELLMDILPEITALGYEIEAAGEESFTIHGVPTDISPGEEQGIMESLIEQYRLNAGDLKLDKRSNLAQSMARQTAIKSGRLLGGEEMKNLVDQLFACQTPYVAPSGRLTFVKYSLAEIEKQFEQKSP